MNWDYYKNQVSEFLSEDEESNYKRNEEIFKMNNLMDSGNGVHRKNIIAK
jgi:hypothetical protein